MNGTDIQTPAAGIPQQAISGASGVPAAASVNLLDPYAVAAAAIAHGAPWEKIDGYKHLFYIEGCNLDGTPDQDRFDKWHDVRGILEYVNGVPQITFKAEATTEPGKYYDAVHVIGWGGKGAALVDLGYQACWQVGTHHPGYAPHEALVQTGAPVNVWRDTARDFTRGQGTIQQGYFGINHHSTGGADANPNTVGEWSAGCLVCPRMGTASHPGHLQYMASLKRDPRYLANKNFVFGVMVMPAQWVIDVGQTQPQQPLPPPPVPVPQPGIPGLVIDVAEDVTAHLSALKAAGVRTIIGYLTTSTSSAKLVKPSEARAIAAAGIRLGLVFEVWGGVNNFEHNDINATTGGQHGAFAKAYAPTLGAPQGAIIWFAIDTDVTASQIESLVAPYFRAAKAALGGVYRIGAYACGAVCQALLDQGIIDAAWLAGAMGWNGSHAFAATSRWALCQGLPEQLAGVDADPDKVQAGADFGDFVPFATVQPVPVPVPVPIPPAPVPTTPLQSARGSWFSQYQGKYTWVDTGDAPDSNALGVPDYCQGVAFPSRATLGKWVELHGPNGVVSIEQQTDIGPSASTGRGIDISAAAAERCGYTPHTFPTDSVFQFRSVPAPAPVANLSPQQQAGTYYQMRGQAAPLTPTPVPPSPTPIPPAPDAVTAALNQLIDLFKQWLAQQRLPGPVLAPVASAPASVPAPAAPASVPAPTAPASVPTPIASADVSAPPSADLNSLIQQLVTVMQTMRGQSTTTPGGAPGTDQQIEQLRKLVEIGRGMMIPDNVKAVTAKLGQVNGALGQTIGNLLDGKKSAIGIIGALATSILQTTGPDVPLNQIIPIIGSSAGLGSVAMPLFLALSAWGVLGKMEKWAGDSPPDPKAQ
jgi:hypothetical protein